MWVCLSSQNLLPEILSGYPSQTSAVLPDCIPERLWQCPARGSAGTVTMCLGHRGRETCEHRNAVFNILRLPAHSRGTPGKNWRMTIMTMNSFIKGASVRKIWASGDRRRWPKLQGMKCMHRGGDAPAQVPPTCSAVFSTHSIFRISSWWKQDGRRLPKWDIQKQNTIEWQMRAWLLVFVFLETRTTFPKSPQHTNPLTCPTGQKWVTSQLQNLSLEREQYQTNWLSSVRIELWTWELVSTFVSHWSELAWCWRFGK